MTFCGAENETRTRDPNLGKVMLYQLSYFRRFKRICFVWDCKGTKNFLTCKFFFAILSKFTHYSFIAYLLTRIAHYY